MFLCELGAKDRPESDTLSVVIPNYNHSAVLERAVLRFVQQSLPPHEIIIVDDASTDESVAVAAALADRHDIVRLLRREIRGGPNAAANTGLSQCTGNYVMFSAADDVVELDLVRRSIEILSAHVEAALCFLDPSATDLASRPLPRIPLYLAANPTFFGPQQVEALFRSNSFSIPSNTVIYRRKHIVAVGGFRANLAWQSDWMANLVLAFRHGACYRPETLAHFTMNPHGYGTAGIRSAEGQRRTLFACLDALKTDFNDVREPFRRAGLLPEYRIRVLLWLLRDRRGRDYLTWRMVRRLAAREIWSLLRPLVSAGVRRWMRRIVAAASYTRHPGAT